MWEVKIETNLLKMHDQLSARLKNPDYVLKEAVLDLYAEVSERIQQRGEDSSGAKIGGGKYSKGYERTRKKAGRQTSYIDLTMTGAMMDRALIPGPTGPASYGIYFTNKLDAQKMEYNEVRFGNIITPTQAEQARALTKIHKAIQDAINRKNK